MAVTTVEHSENLLDEHKPWDVSSRKKDSEYFESVSKFVDQHKDERISIKKLPESFIKITPLEGTFYSDEPEEVNEWGKFYLPEIVKMRVVGVVEGTSCLCDELILMTCEDERLFICDGEKLHVVGRGLDQVKNGDIEYPSDETYYNGQAFKDMTKEDWKKMKSGPVGQRLEEEHRKLVVKNKSEFLENLKSQK